MLEDADLPTSLRTFPPGRCSLVDKHTTYAHNDPNTSASKRILFLKKLVAWLRGLK